MIVYPDTSFLCALYRAQDNSPQADALFEELKEPLSATALLVFEFRQSVRLQTWLHRTDANKGYGESEGAQMMADFQTDLASGLLLIIPADWAKVISRAEQLSAQLTSTGGYRSFDILHVATALELGAKEFLTFDTRQKASAEAAGLMVKS
jgi:predicted nucleic acid-binding protein